MSRHDIIIRVFGPQARLIGGPDIRVTLDSAGISCATLKRVIAAQYPVLTETLAASRIAVNFSFVADEAMIGGSDEIALIGAVSGG